MKDTTIALTKENRDKLFNQKRTPDETYDDVIERLLENYEQ
jgi:hypothetical protein